MKAFLVSLTVFVCLAGATVHAQPADSLRLPQERHLRNIRQLTFGGENGSISPDDDRPREIQGPCHARQCRPNALVGGGRCQRRPAKCREETLTSHHRR